MRTAMWNSTPKISGGNRTSRLKISIRHLTKIQRPLLWHEKDYEIFSPTVKRHNSITRYSIKAVPLFCIHALYQIQRRYDTAQTNRHAINLNVLFIIYMVRNINRLSNPIKAAICLDEACDAGPGGFWIY